MHKQRGRWAGYLVALVVASGACVLLLAACDDGVPTPRPKPTPLVPTATAQVTPTVGMSETETDTNLDELLTEVPDLPTPTIVPTPAGLDDAARVQAFVEVVRALLRRFSPPYVYVSPYVGQGERLDDPNETMPLPQGLLPALQSANGGPKYETLEFADAIGPLEDGGKVKNDGVFITLGEIMGGDQDSDVVIVRGSVYKEQGNAEGDRFRLKRDQSGAWKVLDATQEWRE